jgi:diaminohydroxyphosphoribosylaminopyrimidine deaminase/5-amino-6-(5-phosphoribosylamino)uracil reductase
VDLDRRMLSLAARLALRGMGRVEPNPMVGCVIARDTQILGLGHHRAFGGPHAEIDALESCRRGGHDPAGATAWITLEPCGHRGKTPPCAEALIAAGVREVVYARADPDPSHGGAEALRAAGVTARLSDASPAAIAITDPFVKRATTGLPWVLCKWAQTIDGRIATRAGVSKWISGEAARARVHRLRGRVDAIITGIGTALADDPMLTARGPRPHRRIAHRAVIDPELRLLRDSALARTAREAPLVVICAASAAASARAALADAGARVIDAPEGPGGLDLRAAFTQLAFRFDITTAMVEAGPGLFGSLLEADLADALLVYLAPMVLADNEAIGPAAARAAPDLSDARRFELLRTRIVGPDVELLYRRAHQAEDLGRM